MTKPNEELELVGRDAHSLGSKAEASGLITRHVPTLVTSVDPRGELFFSRYQEDGSLRLYKEGSMLGDSPAGYSDPKVVVKILVVRASERFMVCIPTTRMALDQPDYEKTLAEIAWAHRK